MKRQDSPNRLIVLAALALSLTLAGTLTLRVMARDVGDTAPGSSTIAPAATVPPPIAIVLEQISAPFCWGCSWNKNAPLEFQLDLDLLAPLGDGTGNAAEWFKDFTLRTGARFESEGRPAYQKRFIENTLDGVLWKVLPGDDRLLLEAEPWIDQASCSFYPEIYEATGVDTAIPNLLTFLDLARSWVWRGMQSDDPELAREDFRRAIRLGRLMRQDDVTVIQDLVAVACIRLGSEALYNLARDEGDATAMLVAARVLADKDAIRLGTMARISRLDVMQHIHEDETGRPQLMIEDVELGQLITAVSSLPDRRFRMEGLIGLHVVMHMGSPDHQARAREVLTEFSTDADPVLAGFASHMLVAPLDLEQLG